MYLEGLKHQVVRDLAWAIASPPLMAPDDVCCWYREQWYRQLYADSPGCLRELDNKPERLQEMVESQKDRRMGKYFETLWAFWLDQHPGYEVLKKNLVVRENGRTLGELDFLVLDKTTGRHLHWEMAVKFYLGVGDTRLQSNWHGPGRKDRLDKKVSHLRSQQSVITAQPQVSEMLADSGIHIDECGVILKGRLFYHAGNAGGQACPVDAGCSHEQGRWLTVGEFRDQYAATELFQPLLGSGWMAPVVYQHNAKYINKNNILDMISAGDYRTPLYLGQHPENATAGRVFLVSDEWSTGL